MRAIYGLYSDEEAAQRAFDGLRRAGIERRQIAVMTSEPFEHHEFFNQDVRTRMPWIAVLGGLIGGISGFSLASVTQRLYPLTTGGMAVVSLWPDSIITYELTMLGAILATLATLLITAKPPRWSKQLYDREISDGKILIGVIDPPEARMVELQHELRSSGSAKVRELRSE